MCSCKELSKLSDKRLKVIIEDGIKLYQEAMKEGKNGRLVSFDNLYSIDTFSPIELTHELKNESESVDWEIQFKHHIYIDNVSRLKKLFQEVMKEYSL